MNKKEKVFWQSKIPTHCQITRMEITDEFVDGRVLDDGWALMHPQAHLFYGRGIGVGKGQRYKLKNNGTWVKVE